MAVALAFVAKSSRYFILVRTHVIPVAILAAKAARNVGTQADFGRMT